MLFTLTIQGYADDNQLHISSESTPKSLNNVKFKLEKTIYNKTFFLTYKI